MADKENPKKRLIDEEIAELLKNVADDPETEEDEPEQSIQLTGDPLYDRWVADDESINKYGL